VGLGVMGGAIARNLLASGSTVVGHDIDVGRLKAFAAAGGRPVGSARDVVEQSDVVLLVLPSGAALDAATVGPGGLVEGARSGVTIIEMSTLALEDKLRLRDRLEPLGAAVLDCPISGTGVQAEKGDIVIYASGDEAAIEACRGILAATSRDVIRVGPYGAGSRMKYLANLLVAIHVAAAAEALALARRAGVDPEFAVGVLSSGAGTSRMLELRGPMMATRRYAPAAMALRLFEKDLDVIGAFGDSVSASLPLFATAAGLFRAAIARGFGDLDTSSVHEALVAGEADL